MKDNIFILLSALAVFLFCIWPIAVSATDYEPIERPVFKKLGSPRQKESIKTSPSPSQPKKSHTAEPAKNTVKAPPIQNTPAASGNSGSGSSFKLFGTVGFRRPVDSAPAWVDMVNRNNRDPIFQPQRYFNKQTSWEKFRNETQNLDPLAQLNKVNTFFNRFPYITDIQNWGKQDYWAAPGQFLKKSGDCEDYAIIKYFTLRELGFPPESMRVVVVRDTILNEGHAILAVKVNGKIYILDNQSRVVLPQEQIKNYVPQFSVNELGRWNQLVPAGDKK